VHPSLTSQVLWGVFRPTPIPASASGVPSSTACAIADGCSPTTQESEQCSHLVLKFEFKNLWEHITKKYCMYQFNFGQNLIHTTHIYINSISALARKIESMHVNVIQRFIIL
jgi:hypothetical protein